MMDSYIDEMKIDVAHDQMRLILPIPMDESRAGLMARLRYVVDSKVDMRGQVDLLLPTQGEGLMTGSAHVVIRISGSVSQIEQSRKLIVDEAKRFTGSTEKPEEETDSPLLIPITDFIKELSPTDAREARPYEPFEGVVEYLSVPLGSTGSIIGAQGRRRIHYLVKEKVLVQVPGLVFDDSADQEMVKVKLSAFDETALNTVKSNLHQKAATVGSTKSFALTSRQVEWLLHRNRDQLEQALLDNQVVLTKKRNGIVLQGENESIIGAAWVGIERILFKQHFAKIRFDPNQALATIEKVMEKAAQVSGAEAIIVHSTYGGVAEVMGTVEQLQQALYHLQASRELVTSQVNYQLYEHESIREFVSGKKDGKLVKIMKETGVALHLESSEGKAKLLGLELVGECIVAVLSALDMLMGEFPAELSFYLSEAHHRRLIGHGGKTIQRVMKRHAVYIKFLNPEEALQEAGGAARHLPKALRTRLPNVLVRTPAKNKGALEEARCEIFEMAEEADLGVVKKRLRIDCHDFMRKSGSDLILAKCMETFADSVDFTVNRVQPRVTEEGRVMEIVLGGHQSTLSRFLHNLHLQMPPACVEEVSDDEVELYSSPNSVPLSPARSSTSSHTQGSSCYSWSSESPELFRHFGCVLLEPLTASTRPSGLPSPGLSIMTSSMEEKEPWGFDPIIGSQRQSIFKDGSEERSSPWEGPAFPKLSMMTIDSMWKRRSTELDVPTVEGCRLDWKTMTAEKYRRRASKIFRETLL